MYVHHCTIYKVLSHLLSNWSPYPPNPERDRTGSTICILQQKKFKVRDALKPKSSPSWRITLNQTAKHFTEVPLDKTLDLDSLQGWGDG